MRITWGETRDPSQEQRGERCDGRLLGFLAPFLRCPRKALCVVLGFDGSTLYILFHLRSGWVSFTKFGIFGVQVSMFGKPGSPRAPKFQRAFSRSPKRLGGSRSGRVSWMSRPCSGYVAIASTISTGTAAAWRTSRRICWRGRWKMMQRAAQGDRVLAGWGCNNTSYNMLQQRKNRHNAR